MKLLTLFLAYDAALLGKRSWIEQRSSMHFIATDKDEFALKWQRADRQARRIGRELLTRLVELEGGELPEGEMPLTFQELPYPGRVHPF